MNPVTRLTRLAVLAAAAIACSAAFAPAASADPLDLLPPIASITASPNPVATGELIIFDGSESVDFDGTITRYEWDLDGDGSFETDTDTDAFAFTQYFTPGTHTVSLRVTDTGEPIPHTGVDSVQVEVQAPPSASFDVSPASPLSGENVTFTSTSSDPDGSVTSIDWDFDDDGDFEASGAEADTSFPRPGEVTVSMRATDDDGLTHVATQVITIGNRGPEASFDVWPLSPVTGESISFTSNAFDSDGDIEAQAWDLDNDGSFDDGTGGSASTSFASAGTKTVRLRVTDDLGETAIATQTVTVGNRGPSAGFDYSPASPLTGENVTFTSTSSDPDGSIASQAWDLDNDGDYDDGTGTSASHSFATSGAKTVRLQVTDGNGETDVASRTVTVTNRAPAASFDFAPASPLTGEDVTFTSTSTDADGSIAAHAWDLDNDGSYDDGTGSSATRTFSTSGSKTVKLRVTDDHGATNVATRTVTVGNRYPAPFFTISPPIGITGEQVVFTSTSSDPDGSIASQAWDLDNDGDYDDGTGSTATSTFSTPGVKTVSLAVWDNGGLSTAVSIPFIVQARPPAASFDVSDTSPLSGETVTFTATSTDPDGSIASHAWDLDNDGAFDDGTGTTATTSFSTPGTKTVRLQATDTDGLTDVASRTLTVENHAPSSSFDFLPATPLSGEAITFTSTASDSDGSIASQAWDLDNDGSFDDGTATTATHGFATPGTKTVKLRVTDNDGASNVATRTVTVGNRAPIASFSFSPPFPVTAQTITFTSLSTDTDGSIAGQAWDLDDDGDFDDGTGASASTSFSTPGVKRISLAVDDNNGGTSTVTMSVTVGGRPPVASFTISDTAPQSGEDVTFTATSTDPDNAIAGHAWDLDNDGAFDDATGSSATTSFSTPGTKTVRLQTTDVDGLMGVATRTVTVGNRAPVASFDFTPATPLSGESVTFTSTSTDPDSAVASQAWDLDNDGAFDDGTGTSATTSFSTPGTKTVRLMVTDDGGLTNMTTRTVSIGNRPPAASIDFSPATPLTGETITLTSDASDPDGSIASRAWDLDDDGDFDDGTGSTRTESFSSPGTHRVKLRVTDNDGAITTATKDIVVSNRAPIATFGFSPASPLSGESVTFTSTSTDPDSSIASQAWDLDNDGAFDDATGTSATTSFATPGPKTVSLKVTDDHGAPAVETKSVPVTNRLPEASFTVSPESPLSGQTVTLTGTSTDPDGSIASRAWDLDNDGEFDDASAQVVTTSFPTPGNKTVRMRAIDDHGGSTVATRTISVTNRAPVASFTVSPVAPLSGQTVTLAATASDPDGSISAYAWDLDNDGSFDDGSSSIATKAFATPGAHTVKLRVTDNSGATATEQTVVNVANRPPTASFTYSPLVFQTGDEVDFTATANDPDGSISSYAWDLDNDGAFDDATGASVQNHRFSTPGSHVVTLRVTDNNGAAVTAQNTLIPDNRPPSATFTRTPASALTGESVTFTSTASDPDGSIATQEWDLDDDGTFETTGASASRTFLLPGTYRVKLRVTDSSGATAERSEDVVIGNRAPTVTSISTSPASPSTIEDVTFSSDAADPEGLPLTISWDLDNDGTFDDGSGASVVRSFATAGSYTVKVRAVDSLGVSATLTRVVTVANRVPVASFIQSPTLPSPFETVTFTSTSGDPDGTVASLAWDTDNDGNFDDGTAQTATRKFTESGAFTVRLRVTDDSGAVTVATQTVVIGNRPPVASFGYSPVTPVTGDLVTFYSTSTDPDTPIASYAWDLDGDGIYVDGAGTTATRTFPVGTHSVGLMVTDSEGARTFVTQMITVAAPAPAPAPASAPPAAAPGPTSPRLMSPFPLVRISGAIQRRGSRLRLLSVTAPSGATVVVRCRGRSCPVGRQSSVVNSKAGDQRGAHLLRVKRFERKLLLPGTTIAIFVTKPGTFGKYTTFKIRSNRPPARSDKCLAPGSSKPVSCPGS